MRHVIDYFSFYAIGIHATKRPKRKRDRSSDKCHGTTTRSKYHRKRHYNRNSDQRRRKYNISAKAGDWLEFSFIGYSSKKVKVGSQHVINVNMEEDSKMLDELVVVGYGYQRKSDVATSVTTVKTDEMLSYPAGNVAEMLRGRAAGVTVTSTSGRPGSTPASKSAEHVLSVPPTPRFM